MDAFEMLEKEKNQNQSQIVDEEADLVEEKGLDIKLKSSDLEDFEVTYFKEDIGCIHEVIAPKGVKRGSNRFLI